MKKKNYFSTQSQEYLIEQLQYNGDENITNFEKKDIFLNFRNPVKELFG